MCIRDRQFVRDGVGDLAEVGNQAAAPGDVAVELVRVDGDGERRHGGPAPGSGLAAQARGIGDDEDGSEDAWSLTGR